MPFQFRDLDEGTRRFMIDEIESARRDDSLYFSKRFNPGAADQWAGLLLEAAQAHDEHWLAYQLEARAMLKGLEGSATPSGGYTIKHVPHTASQTLAEGQFNRYYMLGVCRRAIEDGVTGVCVYRAKEVVDPRPESQALVGRLFDPSALAAELRPVDTSLGHPLLQPNSGLSVHL